MLFNSYEFIYIFLPIVFLLYHGLSRYNYCYCPLFLSIASIIFYSVMALSFLPLMLCSILFNYISGKIISKRSNKIFLIMAIMVNIFLLIYYKYFEFFFSIIFWKDNLNHSIIPLGISFYTFTQIAFLVDSSKKKIENYSFNYYLLFVTYFPHLIAGPILHHQEMINQFSDKKRYGINYENIYIGIILFIIGLFKKVIIADNLVSYVNPLFEAAASQKPLVPLESWCAAFAYSFQLYFDFSGYSNMAMGLSKLFNFDLPMNFKQPYTALNIVDFWRRWHISLSLFLKEYLYIPLGGNRFGRLRRYFNLMVTMVLGGLWHGANWTFLIWGFYHGMLLSVYHFINFIFPKQSNGLRSRYIGQCLTFILVTIGWVIFRAQDFQSACHILKSMFSFKELYNIPLEWEKYFGSFSQSLQKSGFKFKALEYFYGKNEIFQLSILACLCLLKVNTQRLIELFSKIYIEVNKSSANKISFSAVQINSLYRFILAPSYLWVLIFITFLVIIVYSIDKRSMFLYFQF